MKKLYSLIFGAALSFLSVGCFAQSTAITGVVVAEQLNGIIDKANNSVDSAIANFGIQAQHALDRLNMVLGDNIAKPIDQLDATLRSEVSAALAVANSINQTLNSLPRCIGNEAQMLLAGVKSGINTTLASVPFMKGEPLAYLIEDANRQIPYVIKHIPSSGSKHLIMRGGNLWPNKKICSIKAEAVAVNGTESNIQPIEFPIVFSDAEKIDLTMPSTTPYGDYIVKVTAKTQKFFGLICSGNESVASAISVVPPQVVDLNVIAVPRCKRLEHVVKTQTVSISANSCNTNTKSSSQLVNFDLPDFRLDNYTFVDNSNARGSASATRSGHGVQVKVEAQNRGNSCSHGKGKGIGTVTLFGSKTISSTLGAPIAVMNNSKMTQGESIPFTITSNADCDTESYSIEVNGEFADEKRIALPPILVATNREETTTEAGVKLYFNGSTRSGTLAMNSTCL